MEDLKTDNRILFLWLNDKEFHSVNARKRGVKTANVYKNLPKYLRILRRLQIILGILSIYPWLENWKKELDKYDTVIIHASRITSPVVKFISDKYPKIRIIVWYWNPVSKCEKLEKYPENICDRWTFDERDAKSYSLKYNTQYYFNDVKLNNQSIDNDVYFIGGDKGRLSMLIDLEKKLNNKGIKTNFHITKTSNKIDNNPIFKERIDYSQNLNFISESKAIVDIVAKGQVGLTLRPLEAMFFNKKLITNDKSIINRDFYNKENIFILDYDNFDKIEYFINSPYIEIPSDILYRYDFNSWIRRFFL